MVKAEKLPRLDPRRQSGIGAIRENQPLPSLHRTFSLFLKRYVFLLLVPLAIVGYGTYCFHIEHELQKSVYAVFSEIGANGFGVSYGKPKRTFFAFTGGLFIENPVLTAPLRAGGASFSSAGVELSVNPLAPDVVTVRMSGAFSLTFPDKTEMRFQVGEATARIFKQTAQEPLRVRIDLSNLTAVSGADGFKIASAALEFSRVKDETGVNAAAYDYALALNGVRLAHSARPLPEYMALFAVRGKVRGFSEKRTKPLLTDWLDNAGVLDVEKGRIVWSNVQSAFSGALGFDPDFNATVAAHAKVFGFFDLLNALEEKGIVRSTDLSVAKIVLGQKLKLERGDSAYSLTLPFSWQSGKFYAGQLLLFESSKPAGN